MDWSHEWSPDLEEVLVETVGVLGASRGLLLSVILSDGVAEDLDPSVIGDLLSLGEILLLLCDSVVEVGDELVLEGLASLLSDLGVLSKLLDSLVVGLVDHELVRMLVEGDELVLSVSLVDDSSETAVLDEVDRGLGDDWLSEDVSEGQDEQFLEMD